MNFVSHLLFGKLWTAVNLYSSCILIVAKLYRFLYFGWEIFLLSIINCFLSWHFNQSLVLIVEVQLRKYFSEDLGPISYVNVSCTLVMLKNIYLIRSGDDLYTYVFQETQGNKFLLKSKVKTWTYCQAKAWNEDKRQR